MSDAGDPEALPEELVAVGYDGRATITPDNRLVLHFDPQRAHPNKLAESPIVVDTARLWNLELRLPTGRKPGLFSTKPHANAKTSPRVILIGPDDDLDAWRRLQREVYALQQTGHRWAPPVVREQVLWSSAECTLVAGPVDASLPVKGFLDVRASSIAFTGNKVSLVVHSDDVRSVSLEGMDEAKNRLGAAVIFGWWALAAKASEHQVYATVQTAGGSLIVIQIRKTTVPQSRGELAPIFSKWGVTVHDSSGIAPAQPVQPQAEPGILDQVRKLGELHDAGILTDEEFQAKKAELLSRL